MRTRRSGGVTLLEVLIVLGLLAIAFGIGFTATHAWRTRTGVRAAAQRLMADLAWARQRAMATSLPTGLGFSSSACSPGYVVVQTRDGSVSDAWAEREVTWDEDDGLVTYVGPWSSLRLETTDPPAVAAGDAETVNAMNLWATAGATRGRYLLFQPNGTVVSRGVPHRDGTRFLVISTRSRNESGALRAADGSVAVAVSPLGEITLEEGAPTPVDASATAALPSFPGRRATTNRDPVIERLEVTPVANVSMLAPGAVADAAYQVRQDGSLALVVTATDPDGDRLSCSWGGRLREVSPDAAPPPDSGEMVERDPSSGHWSIEETSPMTYDAARKRWTSAVEWAPPWDAQIGTWYSLGVCVSDPLGRKAAKWIMVQVVPPGSSKLCYSKAPADWYYVVDGSGTPQYRGRTLVASEVGTEESELAGFGSSWIQYPLLYTHDGYWLVTQSVYIHVDGPSNRPPRLRLIDVESGDTVTMRGLDDIAQAHEGRIEILDVSSDGSRVLYHRTGPLEGVPGGDGACRFQDTPLSGLYVVTLDGSVGWQLTHHALSSPVQARFGPNGHVAAIDGPHLRIWDRYEGWDASQADAPEPIDACHLEPSPTSDPNAPPDPAATPTPSPVPVTSFRWRVNVQPTLTVCQDGQIFELRNRDGRWEKDVTLVDREAAGGATGLVAISGNDHSIAWTQKVPVRTYRYRWDTGGERYQLVPPEPSEAFSMSVEPVGPKSSLGDSMGLAWLADSRHVVVWRDAGTDHLGTYVVLDTQNLSDQKVLVDGAGALIVQPLKGRPGYNSY